MRDLLLNEKKYLTTGNKVSFALSGYGQNLMIGLVNSFLLFFYTDVFRIDKGAVAILMLIARVWDALNDPIMGTVVDKTRTRWGKMRPYLLFIFAPLGLCCFLLFYMPPGISDSMKILYACATFLVWDIVYTICDIPFWGLASTMTPNSKERAKFISHSRLVLSIGGVTPMVLIPVATMLLPPEKAYTYTALVVGIIGAALFSLSFFGTKERCMPQAKAPGIKECINYLRLNKPLQRVVSSNVLGFMRALPLSACMYIAVYLIQSVNINIGGKAIALSGATLNTFIMAGWGIAGYIGMLASPFIFKIISQKAFYILSTICGLIGSVVLFIVGPSLMSIIIALTSSGLFYGIVTNINYLIIADSVDYVEWKTGERSEGVTVAFQTLMNKTMQALQIGLVSLALIVIQFKQPLDVNGTLVNQAQSSLTLNGFFWIASVLPAIGWVLSLLPMLRFNYTGAYRDKITAELVEQRKERALLLQRKEDELIVNKSNSLAKDSLYDININF
ncbi:MAG: glycoside-pentoside-hexuronide (GPH):cation symporter [Christensenellaceae bacterium]|nr:glycoside-pentoside-hexuronide (GPH):cation symporter [Christensenellaceae bacterium]